MKKTAKTPTDVLVPLAEGFEEIEAATIIDVLRRAGLPVVVAGLEPGLCRGAHGLVWQTDRALAEVDPDTVRTLVLPGGMPGAQNLMEDERVLALVRTLYESRRPVSAWRRGPARTFSEPGSRRRTGRRCCGWLARRAKSTLRSRRLGSIARSG